MLTAAVMLILACGILMMLFGCANKIYVAGNADIRMGATVTEVRDNETTGTLKVEKGGWVGEMINAGIGLWK